MYKIMPGRKVPDFEVTLADGSKWRLYDNKPDYMLLIDFYRGYHCPRCKRQLEELNGAVDAFAKVDCDLIAISMDSDERAALTQAEWACDKLKVGHNLTTEDADRLGLYISNTFDLRPMEIKLFSEPAVYIIQSDFTLYGAIVQTFPFARPNVSDLLDIPGFAKRENYPPRGDFVLEEGVRMAEPAQ